jgi:hypothetical protein
MYRYWCYCLLQYRFDWQRDHAGVVTRSAAYEPEDTENWLWRWGGILKKSHILKVKEALEMALRYVEEQKGSA